MSTSHAPLSTSRTLSKINFPLIVLWLASVIVAVVGYLLMTSSNAEQVAIYTAGTADYEKLFAAQSGTTVGGLLIAVGTLGLLLALAAQAATRRRVATPEIVVIDDELLDDIDDEEIVEISPTTVAAEHTLSAEDAEDAEAAPTIENPAETETAPAPAR